MDLDVLQGRSDRGGFGCVALFRDSLHRLFVNLRHGVTLQLSFKGRLNGIQRRVQTSMDRASDRTRGIRVLMKVEKRRAAPGFHGPVEVKKRDGFKRLQKRDAARSPADLNQAGFLQLRHDVPDDPDAESGFFYFGEETGNVVALSITHGAMAVSAASKNPERALMVYDLLRNDEECYRLLCYGIEGVSYEINDEGLRTTPEGYNSDTDNINGMTNWWWGRNDDLEIRDATRNWDAIDKLYSEYDSLKIDYPYGQFVPEVDDIQSKIDNINEVYTNYTKQISYGKYQGTAEEIVAEMQSALKQAGIEEVTAALQEQFDALYK